VQIADVYDALRSERPYKPSFSHEKTVHILTVGDDRIDPAAHFDPSLIALFARKHHAFAEIWDRLQD
jgi:HD-GYP domain-containing protein (c-di-GMP phosphodiesterase class II)